MPAAMAAAPSAAMSGVVFMGRERPRGTSPRPSVARAVLARTSLLRGMARRPWRHVHSPPCCDATSTSSSPAGSAGVRPRGAHRVGLRRASAAEPPPRRWRSAPRCCCAGGTRRCRSSLALVVIELANLAAPRSPPARRDRARSCSGSCSRSTPPAATPRAAPSWVCCCSSSAAIPLAAIEPGDPVAFTDLAFFVMFFGGPLAGGRLVRRRVRARARAGGRARHEGGRGRRRGAHAHRARAARRRVARDQRHRAAGARRAQAARRRAGRDAREAFDVIEQVSEQALDGDAPPARPAAPARRRARAGAAAEPDAASTSW